MRNALLIPTDSEYPTYIKGIYESLHEINNKLENELAAKQALLTNKDLEIAELKAFISAKLAEIAELSQQHTETLRNNEGNKQIIKKLINDVVRKQQDIEWYKRTYETRSLMGTLKEKIFGRRK